MPKFKNKKCQCPYTGKVPNVKYNKRKYFETIVNITCKLSLYPGTEIYSLQTKAKYNNKN